MDLYIQGEKINSLYFLGQNVTSKQSTSNYKKNHLFFHFTDLDIQFTSESQTKLTLASLDIGDLSSRNLTE